MGSIKREISKFSYDCSADLFNLLDKDVSPRSLKLIVEIQKYFRTYMQLIVRLKKKNVLCHKFQMTPVGTDCAKTPVRNYHEYSEIAQENPIKFEK